MKWILALFFFSLTVALRCEEPTRIWTSLEGRTIKAAFVKFDGQKAVFKREDGSTFSLSPSVFSLEDRAFLMNLKTSAEVAASSVTEPVDFAIGATIVLSVRGEASVVGPSAVVPKPDYEGDHAYDGNSTLGFPSSAASGLRVGSIVSSGSQIRVEPHSEVALLFSNGTIATIGANTRMAIKQFQQESFGRYEGNFSRDEEVSSSNLLLDLEVGSLVVDVKKLKKHRTWKF